MNNQDLKAALIHVLGTISRDYSQFNHYVSGSFHFCLPPLNSGQGVYLGHHGEGWFVYLVYLQDAVLKIRTTEGGTELTNYFEHPLNPDDEEVNLFQSLFPLTSDSIIKARKELLKMEEEITHEESRA